MPSRTTLTLLHKAAKKRVFLQGTVVNGLPALNSYFENSVYRQFYKSTLDSFPGAYLLLGAIFCILAVILNAYLYSQRHRMRCSNTNVQEKQDSKSKVLE